MIQKIFKWGIGTMVALLVVWWLNVPFLESQNDDSSIIVTSTPILEPLILQMLGPDTNVVSLVDRGALSKTISLSDKKIAALNSADVIIWHGQGADPYFDVAKPHIPKQAKVIVISDIMTKYEKKWPVHYWMSPISWNKMVHYMQRQLKLIFPNRRSEINVRKMAYTKDIYALHQVVKTSVDTIPRNQKIIATNHPSFGPFANVYGFELVVFDLDGPLDEALLDQMVSTLRQKNITTFHPNESIPESGIDALVNAAINQGWQLSIGKPLFSLNLDAKGSGVDTYIDMMEFNVRSIVDG